MTSALPCRARIAVHLKVVVILVRVAAILCPEREHQKASFRADSPAVASVSPLQSPLLNGATKGGKYQLFGDQCGASGGVGGILQQRADFSTYGSACFAAYAAE
eukprot:scaffold7328_cov314-Pinguiococcus_pyrenoidosus.AAC.33